MSNKSDPRCPLGLSWLLRRSITSKWRMGALSWQLGLHTRLFCVCVCVVFVPSFVLWWERTQVLPTSRQLLAPHRRLLRLSPGLSPEVCRAPMLLHPACLSCALLLSPGSPDPPPQFLLTLFSLLMTPPSEEPGSPP